MAVYTQEDYEELGKQYDLTLLGYAPANVHIKVQWQCNRCKRVMEKNRRSIIYGKYPCPCRREDSLDEDKYRELAEKLGITWIGEHLPPNNKVETVWTVNGKEFKITASYHQLAYGNGAKLKKLIKDVQNGRESETAQLTGLIQKASRTGRLLQETPEQAKPVIKS